MSEDLSRFLKQPAKHYAGARLQQGRVLLDSDFNESAWLEEEEARRAWVDVVGPEGSPDQGYTLGPIFSELATLEDPEHPPALSEVSAEIVEINGVEQSIYNVTFRPGTLFVGGQRYDLEELTAVAFQRDFLQLLPEDPDPPPGEPQSLDTLPQAQTDGSTFRHLYYLHAWDQAVSVVEDQELAETMLKGGDSSVRIRRMQRVQVLDVGEADDCEEAFEELVGSPLAEGRLTQGGHAVFDGQNFELASAARLQVTFDETEVVGDSCAPCVPEDPVYLGSENTTLRIMLTAPERFVWALDNASPVFRIKVKGFATEDGPLEVEMLTPPANERQLPVPNRVVEILAFGALLDAGDLPPDAANRHQRRIPVETGVFARVGSLFDRKERTFVLKAGTPADDAALEAIRALVHVWPAEHPDAALLNDNPIPDERYFYMRAWHQTAASDTALDLPTVSAPALGDTGVKPVFNQLGRRGDYWSLTLRLDTPARVVPFDMTQEGGVAPHGPRHFYSPIALVRGTHAQDGGTPQPAELSNNGDCRARLRKIGDRGCVTLTVGDGTVSSGDFRSIQDAVDALPGSGGRIAVRPGEYDEQILIENRRNVIIEGCGAATVVTTPRFALGGILLEVRNSDGITITGLSLRAAEQRALVARRTTDLVVRDVSAVVGSFEEAEPLSGDDPEFVPEVSRAILALVELTQVGSALLEGLDLHPAQRLGLALTRCELVTITGLTASGVREAAAPPSGALVSISDSELVRIDDSALEAFGQVGVVVRGSLCRDIELRDLTVLCGPCEYLPRPDPDEPEVDLPFQVEPANPGVDIENGDGIRLHRSRILLTGGIVSEHACVVVHGRSISVEGNVVETEFACAPPLQHEHASEGESGDIGIDEDEGEVVPPIDPTGCGAFGGIQIRGGSTSVEVRGNRVQNGIGHGITIGSVLWHRSEEPVSRARRIGGAGTGQYAREEIRVGDDTLEFMVIGRDLGAGFQEEGDQWLPVSEGTIRDLLIADNTVQGMRGSGISVITVMGLLSNSFDFIEIEGGRIEGNRIEGNVTQPGTDLPDVGDAFPFPGSVYGPTVISVLPFGGIVLGSATAGVDIRNNVIRNNALNPDSITLPICGIFVLQGEGIAITGNRVTDNGLHSTELQSYTPGVRAGIAVMLAGTGDADDLRDVRRRLAGQVALRHPNTSLRVVNNTVLQPEGRALHAIATGPIIVDGNYLASLGNHGAELQSDRYMVGDVVFVQSLGTPWEALGLTQTVAEKVDDQYFAADHAIAYLTNQQDDSPWYFVGDGGQVLFANNQVVYDWDVTSVPSLKSRAPLSYFPAAVIGLDHVGVNANQFMLRLNGERTQSPLRVPTGVKTPRYYEMDEPMLAHVLVLGGTVDVTRNRVSENVGSVLLSMITNAEIMNITSLNQTTHVNAAFVMASTLKAFEDEPSSPPADPEDTKFLRNERNQVLFIKNWPIPPANEDTLPNTLLDTSPGPPAEFLKRIRRLLSSSLLRLLQNQNR